MQDTRLALFGGKPLVANHETLRIDWPIVSDASREAITQAINSKDFSGRGSPSVYALEDIFIKKYGGYATGLNSGTAAIHAALLSLGVEPGDEVIVPNLTFVATAAAVLHALAIPVFADISPDDFNIEPSEIERLITPRTKAVIVVHLHGLPAKMREIVKICKENSIMLIEDVAQAPGAKYNNQDVGTFGDAAAFSLMPQKNIGTCGECGVLLTKTIEQKNRAEMLRIYGEIVSDNKPRLYNSFSLGWNYTLGPLEAAMAKVQFLEYPPVMEEIQMQARKLTQELSKFKWVTPPKEPSNATSVFHFYRLRVTSPQDGPSKGGRFRRAIQDALDAEGLNVRHYQNTPVSGQIIFKEKRAFGKNLPWSLSEHVPKYDIDSYPNTLDVLSNTLVLGAISSAPGYLLCEGTVEKYIKGFEKIDKNMDKIISYAEQVDYREPWEDLPTTSDSFKGKYGVISED